MFSKLLLFCLFSLTSGYIRYNNEMSTQLSRMWDLDTNRCEPGVDYELDIQGYVTNLRWRDRDRAQRKLFKTFNETKIFAKPTYRAFKNLLDNYNADTDILENDSVAEKAEIESFLNLLIQTDVIKEAHRFLKHKGKVTGNISQFKTILNNLWFKIYKRLRTDRRLNSSGFEHVFVGERRNSEVSGFHNWIQFYLQEKSADVDYRGFFRRGTTEELETHPHLMTLQFIWKRNYGKGLGSCFIGVSPEFEIAVFTLVHLMRFQSPPSAHIKRYDVQMVTRGHNNNIGSAYPKSLSN